MLTLVILVILASVFVLLAKQNWRRTIGAGPTILIVGALVLSLYVPIKWNTYQSRLREYDVCASRVERSEDANRFNSVLINFILQNSPPESAEARQLAKDLQDASPKPLKLETDCPREPHFKNIFFSGFQAEARVKVDTDK